MKKIFTLATAATLAAASFSAQAQVTVDGVLTAPELTSGNYVLLGKFTNYRSFGDHGLLSMYAASTPTKLYIFVAGTVETNLNGFQLFMGPTGWRRSTHWYGIAQRLGQHVFRADERENGHADQHGPGAAGIGGQSDHLFR